MCVEQLLDSIAVTRNTGAIASLLMYRGDMNQRELAGIMAAMNELMQTQTVSKLSQQQIWVDILRMAVRCQL